MCGSPVTSSQIGIMACSIHTAFPPQDHMPNVPAFSMRARTLFIKVQTMPSQRLFMPFHPLPRKMQQHLPIDKKFRPIYQNEPEFLVLFPNYWIHRAVVPFLKVVYLKILQFPALTLCNSANGGKALIIRRLRYLPFPSPFPDKARTFICLNMDVETVALHVGICGGGWFSLSRSLPSNSLIQSQHPYHRRCAFRCHTELAHIAAALIQHNRFTRILGANVVLWTGSWIKRNPIGRIWFCSEQNDLRAIEITGKHYRHQSDCRWEAENGNYL